MTFGTTPRINTSHAIACSKIGMFCQDCDMLIKLQTIQMTELGIKRNFASETKQYIKRKSIKKMLCVWYRSISSLRTFQLWDKRAQRLWDGTHHSTHSKRAPNSLVLF